MAWERIFYMYAHLGKKGHHPPLVELIKGPHLAIDRSSKYFTVITDHGLKKVSIDRLKHAYVIPDIIYEVKEQIAESLIQSTRR